MKLTDNRMQDILVESVGEDCIRLVEYIDGKRDISEFKISAALKMEIQEVRQILYRLHSKNLVTYKRKKDNKKGWYISYWTFNKGKIKELQQKIKTEKLEKFRERLEEENRNINSFFLCPRACIRMDFNNAIDCNFRCPECGTLMQQQDNVKTINFLKEKIREIEAVA